jgi:hypothetical protein
MSNYQTFAPPLSEGDRVRVHRETNNSTTTVQRGDQGTVIAEGAGVKVDFDRPDAGLAASGDPAWVSRDCLTLLEGS